MLHLGIFALQKGIHNFFFLFFFLDRLTDCDCKILQKNFKDISKSVNGKLLLDRLFNNGVITEEDAFRLSEEDVSNEECLQFLICDVLLKHGTYTDLEKFHIALALNKQDDACKFFPSFDREDSDESDKIGMFQIS